MHQYVSRTERVLRGSRLSACVDRTVGKEITDAVGPHDAAMALLVVGGRTAHAAARRARVQASSTATRSGPPAI